MSRRFEFARRPWLTLAADQSIAVNAVQRSEVILVLAGGTADRKCAAAAADSWSQSEGERMRGLVEWQKTIMQWVVD